MKAIDILESEFKKEFGDDYATELRDFEHGFSQFYDCSIRAISEALNSLESQRSVPLPTNQKLWDMAKVIVEKQKEAKKLKDDVDWDILEDDWFDWLGEEILGNAK